MKKFLLTLLLAVFGANILAAQEYNLVQEGQENGGNYLVKVSVILDKKQYKEANDWVKRVAAEGVLFRGVAAAKGLPSQKALVTDPTVATSKAEFFQIFNDTKLYNNYVTIKPNSVVSTQLPKKKYQVTAVVSVDKEALVHLLEDSGVVQGMGNLW